MLDRVETTAPSLNHAPGPNQMSGGAR
jgi:hypothetical protein